MSNTAKRIISAFVLLGIVFFCLWKGRFATLNFILVAGILSIDEICQNLLNHKRNSIPYILNQLLFISGYIFISYIENVPGIYQVAVNITVLLDALLLFFLFQNRTSSEKLFAYLKDALLFQVLPTLLILFPMLSLTYILSFGDWVQWLLIFFMANFGMDTGAWFFGRKFGKRKLWEAVSPKKTIEGTIGGVFTGATLAFIYTWVVFGKFPPIVFYVLFGLIAASSQLGDLFQSKLKRIADIKDSSGLIPGHGGVYDRLDSMLFSVPLFAILLTYLVAQVK